jgi:hypothetical protein
MWDGWELVPVGELLVLERGMVLVIEQVVEVVQVELDKGALDHEHGVAPRLDQIEDELHRTRDQARVLPVGGQTPNMHAHMCENSTILYSQYINIATCWRTYSVPNMVCVLPEPVWLA